MEWHRLLNRQRARPTTNKLVDNRVEFERDFDRAVFSSPVKRLQDKAQVFPLDPHDSVRTRLTHSLEVSSVARGLATGISRWLLDNQQIEPGMDRSIEAICATCGLIHDLGNPPFGHSGEDAIRTWFIKRFGEAKLLELLQGDRQLVHDFLLFEGNAQTLRLVAKLQVLADFHGLNLTYGTLSANCKYTASAAEANAKGKDHARSKPGYFASERHLVQLIRDATGTATARNPLTFLIEAADDIVYSVADIEDGIKKGLLLWDNLRKELTHLSGGVEKHVAILLARKESILQAGRDGPADEVPDDLHGAAFRTAAISVLVPEVIAAFKANYDAIMQGTFSGELVGEGTIAPLVETLKRLARRHLYGTPSNLKLEIMGRNIIHDLMDTFWEGAELLPLDGDVKTRSFPGKIGALLSPNYRKVFAHSVKADPALPEIYHRFQLVTDYICGMTDTFAKRLHAELTNRG